MQTSLVNAIFARAVMATASEISRKTPLLQFGIWLTKVSCVDSFFVSGQNKLTNDDPLETSRKVIEKCEYCTVV